MNQARFQLLSSNPEVREVEVSRCDFSCFFYLLNRLRFRLRFRLKIAVRFFLIPGSKSKDAGRGLNVGGFQFLGGLNQF